MPIRKKNRNLYPPDWTERSLAIRRDRAKWHCERCGIAQGARSPKGGKVMLTVAHLDHNPANCDPANLQAMCNACHLAYDLALHVMHTHETRRWKQEQAGQLPLFEPRTPEQIHPGCERCLPWRERGWQVVLMADKRDAICDCGAPYKKPESRE